MRVSPIGYIPASWLFVNERSARNRRLRRPARRPLAAVARSGAYTFGGGNGSRPDSGWIFPRIAWSWLDRRLFDRQSREWPVSAPSSHRRPRRGLSVLHSSESFRSGTAEGSFGVKLRPALYHRAVVTSPLDADTQPTRACVFGTVAADPSPVQPPFPSRAIPCSAAPQQRHKVIRNGVALVGEESVSGVTGGSGRGTSQENPPMRIYIIGNYGMTLSREAPARLPSLQRRNCTSLHSAASGC